MIRYKPLFLLGLLLIIIGSIQAAPAKKKTTQAHSQFDNFEGDGYYWYKVDPEEEVKPKEEPPKSPPAAEAPSKPPVKALSAEWLRTNMPKLLDAAIDNPTNDNVANYMYVQRVLLDKSQNFSTKVKDVVATDPFLDENNRIPFAQFAQQSVMIKAREGHSKAFKHIASKSGLWVFVDTPEACPACETYVHNIIFGTGSSDGIARRYNFPFRKIYVNTPEGKIAARRLKLTVTPTTVLVSPPNGFYLISQGLMAETKLGERLLIAARVNGMLTKEMEEGINPFNKGILTTEQMDGLSPNGDPSEVMEAFRRQIGIKE